MSEREVLVLHCDADADTRYQLILPHRLRLNKAIASYLPPSACHNRNRQNKQKDQQHAENKQLLGCTQRWLDPLANH